MSRPGVIGLIGQVVVCVRRCTGGTDTRRGALSSAVLVGSLSERIASRFGPEWLLPLAGFESAVRVVLEFITD